MKRVNNLLISIVLVFMLSLGVSAMDVNDTIGTNKEDEKGLWHSTLDIGLQILPDYNENGENQGFNKSRMFANINFDSRWIDDNASFFYLTNVGIDMKLLGTANNDVNRTASIPSSFNNISDTLDLSIYYQFVPNLKWFKIGNTRNIFSEIGFITHFGIRSRKEKSINNDTVDTYADIGVKYSFFRENPYSDNKGMAKGLPDFYIGGYYRQYSDYNGFNSTRYIIDFKYKVLPHSNFFLGAEANLGDKDDELYLTLTFRNDIEKLFSFF